MSVVTRLKHNPATVTCNGDCDDDEEDDDSDSMNGCNAGGADEVRHQHHDHLSVFVLYQQPSFCACDDTDDEEENPDIDVQGLSRCTDRLA